MLERNWKRRNVKRSALPKKKWLLNDKVNNSLEFWNFLNFVFYFVALEAQKKVQRPLTDPNEPINAVELMEQLDEAEEARLKALARGELQGHFKTE